MLVRERDWMRCEGIGSLMQIISQEQKRILNSSSSSKSDAESGLEEVREGRGLKLPGDWEIIYVRNFNVEKKCLGLQH